MLRPLLVMLVVLASLLFILFSNRQNDNKFEDVKISQLSVTKPSTHLNANEFASKKSMERLHDVESDQTLQSKSDSLPCKIVFVKIPKCASSTVGGIARRIADNSRLIYSGVHRIKPVSRFSRPANSECAVFAGHSPKPHSIPFLRRKVRGKDDGTLLFSFVRDPDSRILSEYFHFHVSRKHESSDDESVIRYIKRRNSRKVILKWLADWIPGYKISSCLDNTFDVYDFIGVVERMDESIVALKMMLNLSWFDVLHVGSSKVHGAYDDTGAQIVPSVKTDAIGKFFQDFNKQPKPYPDRALHIRANQVLDESIKSYGSLFFQSEVKIYQNIIAELKMKCEDSVKFPYDSTGKPQKRLSRENCYWNDNGCGVPCMNKEGQSIIDKMLAL